MVSEKEHGRHASESEPLRDARKKALALAEDAEAALVEEYAVLRQVYEKNPTMAAIARGVHAIRALRAEVEANAKP